MIRYYELKRDIQGAALAYVVVAMVVVFLLISGLITLTQAENNQSLYQMENINAYYVARAGAQTVAMEMMHMHPDMYDQFLTGPQTVVASGVLDGVGDVSVVVTRTGTDYRLVSTGTYDDQEAIVRIKMSYSDRYEFDYAAYSWEQMGTDASNGDVGIGPVYGSLVSNGDIYIKVNDIGQDTLVRPGEEHYLFIDEANVIDSDYSEVIYSGGDLTVSDTTRFIDLVMGNNEDLIINTNNAEYLKTDNGDNFTMSDAGTGNGDWLVLYLDGDCEIQGKVSINGSENCMIIVDDALVLGGGLEINTPGLVEIHVIDDVASDTFELSPESEVDYELQIEGNVLYGVNTGTYTFDNTPSPNDFTGVNPYNFVIYIHEDQDPGDDNGLQMDGNMDFLGIINAPTGKVYFKNGSTNLFGSVYANEIEFKAEPSIIQPTDIISSYALYQEMQIDYWE